MEHSAAGGGTAAPERIHIAFFGMRNAGKSSVVNAVTGQELSIVSPVGGTTTDPVRKAMELLPLGPAVIIDTPGIDDEGALGALRVQKARRVLDEADVAVLVVDAARGLSAPDRELLPLFAGRRVPCLIAYNKADLLPGAPPPAPAQPPAVYVSAKTGAGIRALKDALAALAAEGRDGPPRRLAGDLVRAGDVVVLVIPIDGAAPRGRLIMPQQMVLRDLLDAGALPFACGPDALPRALAALREPPALVITDSQAFGRVNALLPADVPLTSFSILMARYKGTLEQSVRGAAALDSLRDGDTVLISEGCTHHRQCGDIGTVKLPAWCRAHTGRELRFAFTSGGDFPEDVARYALVIHCGGCMLNEREMQSRLRRCARCGTPATNYGTAIAHIHGILPRSLEPLRPEFNTHTER